MASNNSEKSCQICNKSSGKYVCPRCNILYCSLTCYRNQEHSSCSEEFYRRCVQEELLTNQASENENPKAMLEILQRMHEQEQSQTGLDEDDNDNDAEPDSDDSSGGGGEDLAERLAGVNLDDADSVWEKLSREEKEHFQRILTSGDPSDIIPVWEPWWTYRIPSKPLVEELSDDAINNTSDLNFQEQCPRHRDDIPGLANPSKANPAVQYGVDNVMYAYVLMARYYAGDHIGDLHEEAAQTLMQLSSSLSRGQNFTDRETALASVTLEATQSLGMSEENLILGREDLESITQGPGVDFQNYYILSALSDSINLLTSISEKKENSKSKKGEFSRRFAQPSQQMSKKWTKKHIMLAVKKLEFYIAWTKCQ